MSAAPSTDYLDNLLATQAAARPKAVEQHQYATRYIFTPFNDRLCTMEQVPSLGFAELKAGYILPIVRRSQWIVDNKSGVQSVPVDYAGNYEPAAPGIDSFKALDRPPGVVLEAILRIFNMYHGVDPQQDNGLCEVVALRGSDDFNLLREIQRTCMPTRPTKARQQLLQLARVVLGADCPATLGEADDVATLSALVESVDATGIITLLVAKELYRATVVSFTWATWQYENLVAQFEDQARWQKRRLSPLDKAVCEWIEKPEPRIQSKLQQNPQTVVVQQAAAPIAAPTPTIPQIQCSTCGSFSNLLADGGPPRKCVACGEGFTITIGESADGPITVPVTPAPARTKTLAEKQAEAQERNKK